MANMTKAEKAHLVALLEKHGRFCRSWLAKPAKARKAEKEKLFVNARRKPVNKKVVNKLSEVFGSIYKGLNEK